MNTQLKYQDINPSLQDNIDVVGSFFINFFYNDLFISSKRQNNDNNSGKSLTSAYVDHLQKCLSIIESNPTFISKPMHKYYQDHRSHITLRDFENKFLGCFIPSDFLKSLNDSEKSTNFAFIINSMFKALTENVIAKYLPIIIDQRNIKGGNGINIRLMQDLASQLLMQIRESYYTKLVETTRNANSKEIRLLMSALKQERNSKIKVENDLKTSLEIINALKKRINELLTMKKLTPNDSITNNKHQTPQNILPESPQNTFTETPQNTITETPQNILPELEEDDTSSDSSDEVEENSNDEDGDFKKKRNERLAEVRKKFNKN